MKEYKNPIIVFILVIAFLMIVMWVGSKGGFVLDGKQDEPKTEQAEPLNITIPTPETDGTLTVYDEMGQIAFQYAGEINILNSGRNGEPIEINVTIPSAQCSCFNEEGRLEP